MVSQNQGLILILPLFLFTLCLSLTSSISEECGSTSTGGIVMFWGQDESEGSLQETCSTGNYQYVILNYLSVSDEGNTKINFAGHCESSSSSDSRLNLPSCKQLESQIKSCQKLNIKVLLNVGSGLHGLTTTTKSSSSTITEDVAKNIYDNFLGGDLSGQGPLGNVLLDGIDLTGFKDGKNINWYDLVTAIKNLAGERKISFSAAQECSKTSWINPERVATFDYVFPEFFHELSCAYDLNANKLLKSWETWTSSFPNSKVFLGIPASQYSIGYIKPETLKEDVLPVIKESSNYGGVMVFNRYFDKQTGYSNEIKEEVPISVSCTCVCEEATSRNSYGILRQY